MAFELWELAIIGPFAAFVGFFLLCVYRKRKQLNNKRNHKTFAVRIDQIIAADVQMAQKAREAYTDVRIEREDGDFAAGDKVLTSETDENGRIPGIVKQQKGLIFQVEMSRGYPKRPKLQMFKAEQLKLDNSTVKPVSIPDKYTVEVMDKTRTPSSYRRSNDSTEAIAAQKINVEPSHEENVIKRSEVKQLTKARARPLRSKRVPHVQKRLPPLV